MTKAKLLVIGNELLNGEIRDRNLFTLTRALTRLGFVVDSALMVRDHAQAVAQALAFVLEPALGVLICSGGLGPTDDDLTLSALATALERPLQEHAQARDLVEQHYDRLLAQKHLSQRGPLAARRKMAMLPSGAEPLPNPIGTAPGVKLIHENTVIYVLPGVPAELDAIFAESVAPELLRTFELDAWIERELIVHCDDEADLAAPLRDVAQQHPDVYLKSLARPFPSASREGLRVIAAARSKDATAALHAVQLALHDLRKTLTNAGFPVRPFQENNPSKPPGFHKDKPSDLESFKSWNYLSELE